MPTSSRLLFLITGFIGSTLIALLSLSHTIQFTLLSYWIGLYGLMLLLATPYRTLTWQTFFVPLILSLLAALPYYWTQDINFAPWLLPFFSSLSLNAWHIQIQKNKLSISYSILFHAIWDTFIKLCITALFVLLCWIILLISDELFKSIKITLIKTLISKTWFDLFASGIFTTFGLYITAERKTVIQYTHSILTSICQYLLAPLSIIGILFIITVIAHFTQHQTLPKSEFLFLSIAFLSLVFLNGLYQDGKANIPYPHILFWTCRIFIIITPLFSLLALRTLYLNGITQNNFSDFLNATILLSWNSLYAITALGKQKPLFAPIEKINITLSLLLICTNIITTNPLVMSQIPQRQSTQFSHDTNVNTLKQKNQPQTQKKPTKLTPQKLQQVGLLR